MPRSAVGLLNPRTLDSFPSGDTWCIRRAPHRCRFPTRLHGTTRGICEARRSRRSGNSPVAVYTFAQVPASSASTPPATYVPTLRRSDTNGPTSDDGLGSHLQLVGQRGRSADETGNRVLLHELGRVDPHHRASSVYLHALTNAVSNNNYFNFA